MIAGHKPLYRITFGKKSAYCGRDIHEASRKYFELEPEATEESPLEWHVIVTTDNPLEMVQRQLLRRAPGENSGVIDVDFELTPPADDE